MIRCDSGHDETLRRSTFVALRCFVALHCIALPEGDRPAPRDATQCNECGPPARLRSPLAPRRRHAITRPPNTSARRPRTTDESGSRAMQARARTDVGSLAGALALGLAGCLGPGTTPAVRDAARPAKDQILADAPALLPPVPVASTSASRGQSPE